MLRVARRPEVAILSTGDELVDVGEPLGPGQIVNSNAYTLAAAVEEAGASRSCMGIVRDRPELISAAFADAMRADVVLSTGGVSVGNFDYVRASSPSSATRSASGRWRRSPASRSPSACAGATPVFGLPGNPVSSLVCFYLYVVPALRTMMGLARVHLPSAAATLAEAVRTAAGLTEFVRCSLEGSPDDYRPARPARRARACCARCRSATALIVAPPGAAVLRPARACGS